MNDAFLVRGFEGLRDLQREGQRIRHRDGAPPERVRERGALDELQDEKADPARVLEPVDRRDVRVIESGQQPGLALESGESIGIGSERVGQALDRDIAIEDEVSRPPHFAHAAPADRGENLVMAEPGAGSNGGVRARILSARPRVVYFSPPT